MGKIGFRMFQSNYIVILLESIATFSPITVVK